MEPGQMNAIQTKVYCPECGKELSINLKPVIVPGNLKELFKTLHLPDNNDFPYKGDVECSCGKIVRATFVITAVPKEEYRKWVSP